MACGHHHWAVFTTFLLVKMSIFFTKIDGNLVKLGDGQLGEELNI